MPFPCRVKGQFTHTMPFPCRDPATTLPFSDSVERGQVAHMPSVDGRANSHIPCRPHAVPMPRLCRGLERSLSGRYIRGMTGERHGMCESNTAALCKSNGKDTI
jgi:hypothetical protein